MLRRTTRDGFIDDYQGTRITSTGRRFRIRQAIVWNLVDEQIAGDDRSSIVGRAATFSRWEMLDD